MKSTLANFQTLALKDAARHLLNTLGYKSDKFLVGSGSKPQDFLDNFASAHPFDQAKALVPAWKSADLLFQLTDQELNRETSLFSDTSVKTALLRSYIFIAIELKGSEYTRTTFSSITRQINRLFPMPVMVLFKHQDSLTIAVINRRANKFDESKDVLGKVTLISNINLAQPHRGHLDILGSLELTKLVHPQKKPINDFDSLHAAWEQIFNTELLNKRFYRELANWYFWALPQVEFPADLEPNDEKRRATGLIRLLTRLIFCWFLKEKNLVPEKLFHPTDLAKILLAFDPQSETKSTYYLAILQNLFFATLNQRMSDNENTKPSRSFAKDDGFLKNKATYDINNLYRYESLFRDNPDDALAHFSNIPFLNGGLFECLDRTTDDGTNKKRYIDGFSRNPKKRPSVPDHLFFAREQEADLSSSFGDTKRRKEKVSGLIHILNRYKFTITENTPIDQEIALDPELLGKVFENLLASYNEETKTTARKQTGSFYTPRPIVDYMVDESLKAHLERKLTPEKTDPVSVESLPSAVKQKLDNLFTYTETEHTFTPHEVETLITAIDTLKILDPACGSGAFPMGVLHKLVYILGKLDPDNNRWKHTQLQKLDSAPMREELERTFADNNDDYGRKLYLIENCLYGVDIQPIAIQITKLRFFISLVCDQKTTGNKTHNLGIRPLPNLETKFVAANTLIGLPQITQLLLVDPRINHIEKEIESLYHNHFSIQRRDQKLSLQRKLKTLRQELATLLAQSLMAPETARHIAEWDPFDPQSSANFFDPQWMFGRSLKDGFDVVLGNPPYVRIQSIDQAEATELRLRYTSAIGKFDIYVLFVECAFRIVSKQGLIFFIHPHRFLTADYGRGIKSFLDKVNGLRSAILFGVDQVFNAATTYTGIFSYSSGNSGFGFKHANTNDFYMTPITQRLYYAAGSHWNLSTENSKSSNLIDKLRNQPQKLATICTGIFQGIVTVGDDIFVLKGRAKGNMFIGWSGAAGKEVELELDIVRPLLKGEDIQRYQPPSTDIWILYPHYQDSAGKTRAYSEAELRVRFPKAFHYIKLFKEHLIAKKIQYKTNPDLWFSLHRSREMSIFEHPKILTPQLQNYPSFTFDVHRWYTDAGGYSLVLKDPTRDAYLFLLGVMNSSLLWYFIRCTSSSWNNSYYYFKTKYLELFSLPAYDKAKQTRIATLAERVHQAKDAPRPADTSALEREIDQLVYALYGLTPEEIAIVEGSTQ